VEHLESRLAPANVPVLSGHYDGLLSGANTQEQLLTPANVNPSNFGALYNYAVDGNTYAQPLYVPNLTIPGKGTHNVVFAATEHDSVYAFDADGGGQLWKRSFLDPANGVTTVPYIDVISADVAPEVGITGTPVIDGATNTLYVVARTKEVGGGTAHYVQKLHALDITTGLDRAANGVVTIGDTTLGGPDDGYTDTTAVAVPGSGVGSDGATVRFNALRENQRTALALANGVVYLAWASHGDNGPYHGWVVGYQTSNLSLAKVFNTSPYGNASGIWESGGGLGVDAAGNLYLATGNGFGIGFNANSGGPTALGAGSGGLGYQGIGNSVSVRFQNSSTNTGLGTNGVFGPDVTLPGFDFNAAAQAGNTFTVTLSYNASTKTLTENIVNNNVPGQTFTTSYNVDLPATVGDNSAFVGFTGGTGGLNAEQDIKTWTFTNGSTVTINHGNGFASTGGLTANGGAALPLYTSPSPVGIFQYHQDLGIPGDPVPAGTASYNGTLNGGTYTLTASGDDIGFKVTSYDTDTDRMQYVYTPMSGTNGEIIARVNGLTSTDFWTKAVVQIRQSLDPQAANATSVMSPHDASEMTWRDAPPAINNAGNQSPDLTGAQERAIGTGPLPGWIRLVRDGDTFKSFWAVDTVDANGNHVPGPWQGEIDHDVAMTGDVYVGIGLCAHANGLTATATFDHVTVTGFTARTQTPDAILTPAANGQASSIFANNKVDISGNWSTTFTFQLKAGSNPVADGMTFTIQNADAGTEVSESVLKLSTTGQLSVADYFTPRDWQVLDQNDADLGSGGTMLLPDAVGSAAHPHLLVETGKTGRMYLIDRDNMGKFNTRYDQVVQIVTLGGVNTSPGVYGNPAFFQDGPNTGLLYYWGSGAPGQAFRITGGVVDPNPVTQTNFAIDFPGAQPSISANGTDPNSAILWALRVDNYGQRGPAELMAFKAEDLTQEIYSSTATDLRDQFGSSVKFTFPVVSNGHVFAGSNGFLTVFGLFPTAAAAPAAPSNATGTAQPGGAQIQLSWTNNFTAATANKIYRSTDNVTFQQIATVSRNATTFTDSGLTPATFYYYRVVATNQKGDSAPSNTATVRTRIAAPVLTVADIRPGAVELSWTGTANNHYDIKRSTDGTTFTKIATVPATQTTFLDSGLANGTSYYQVTAASTFPEGTDTGDSGVAQATIGPININHFVSEGSPGFTSHGDMAANGSAQFTTENLLRLNNSYVQSGSAFTLQRVGVRGFTTSFQVRLHEGTQPNPADGFTFTLQPNGPTALGPVGAGSLGYQGIPNSVAIKFDTYDNQGETANSTGLFFNGDFPGLPQAAGEVNIPLDPANVNLRSQSTKTITLTYDGTTLTETIHDPTPGQTNNGDFTATYTVDIAGIIGADTAYAGFTGGTSPLYLYSLQDVLNWKYSEQEGNLPPRVPSALQVTSVVRHGANRDITLSWKSNNAYTAQGFLVQRSADNVNFTTAGSVSATTVTFTDLNVAPGTFYYRVRSFNAQGQSGPSNTATTVSEDANVAVTLSTSATNYGQPVTLSAKVTPALPGSTDVPGGTVFFWDGPVNTGILLGSAPLDGSGTGSLAPLSTLHAGTHTINVSYSGDNLFNPSTGGGNQLVVSPDDTSTTLSSAPNPSAVGQAVVFTATVVNRLAGGPTPVGSVTFTIDNGTPSAPVALDPSGHASYSVATLGGGTHTVVANFLATSDFNASFNAPALTQTVLKPSQVVVSSSLNPSAYGQAVVFTATVSAAPGYTGTPGGSVTFVIDGTPQASPVNLDGSGKASITISAFGSGAHTVGAVYNGDPAFAQSTATPLTQTVNADGTTTVVSASPASPIYGQTVTLTATLSNKDSAATVTGGTVSFYDGSAATGTLLGSAPVSGGTASLPTAALPAGASHTLTAVYSGAPNFAGSSGTLSGFAVSQAHTTTSVSASPASSVYGQTVTLTATLSNTDTSAPVTSGTVSFYDGSAATGTLLGTAPVSGGTATLPTAALPAGASHTLTAVYSGAPNFVGSTGARTGFTVSQATTSIALSASPNPAVFGQAVTVTATVTSPTASTAGTTVTFVVDGASQLPATLDANGQARITLAALALGSHTVSASYAGNGNLAGSGPASMTEKVVGGSTTSLTASANPVGFGQAVTFTATVRGTTPGIDTLTGMVTFVVDGVARPAVALDGNQQAALTLSSLGAGQHTVGAVYGGTDAVAGSTATPLTETVNKAVTALSLTTSALPIAVGQPVTLTATVTSTDPLAAPDGTVTFIIDNVPQSPVALNAAGQATLTISTLATGTHLVTASYGGTANFAPASLPQPVTVLVAPFLGGPDEVWINQIYRDVLGRSVNTADLNFWVDQLEAGMPRATIAQQFVNSPEYQRNFVLALFRDLLHRTPSADELNYHLQFLAGGATYEQLTANFLGAAEYFQAGGRTDPVEYVNDVYQYVLGHAAGSDALPYWLGVLQSTSHHDMALAVLQTPEAKGRFVRLQYEKLLVREPDGSPNFWFQFLVQGGRDQDVTLAMITSNEYFTRGAPYHNTQAQEQAWVKQLYVELLGRQVDAPGLASWFNTLERGTPRLQITEQIVNSAEYRSRLIGNLFQSLLNRAPSASDLSVYQNYLLQGQTVEQLKATILGSAEYSANRGGGTALGFLSAAYHDVLGRALDGAGAQYWGGKLAAGEGHEALALELVHTLESDNTVVQRDYAAVLGRPADPSGMAYWAGQLQADFRDEYVLAELAATREYFNRFKGG
jgi:hypothetical protein